MPLPLDTISVNNNMTELVTRVAEIVDVLNSGLGGGDANNVNYLGGFPASCYARVNAASLYITANVIFTGTLSANGAAITSVNALALGGKTEGQLNANSALTANNATYAYGKIESALNVNNAVTLAGKTEDALNVNNAITANSATTLGGKTEAALNVNSAAFANNASYLNGHPSTDFATGNLAAMWVKLDSIASQFNGAQTVFSLTSANTAVIPASSQSVFLSLSGVWQEPNTAFTISGSTITFTAAPLTGESFFGVMLNAPFNIASLPKKLDALTFNGAQTVFTLASAGVQVTPTVPENLILTIDGQLQEPTTAYTVSGNTVTFTSAPANNATFFGVLLGQLLSVGTITPGVDISPRNIDMTGTLTLVGTTGYNGQLSYSIAGNTKLTIENTANDLIGEVRVRTGGVDRLIVNGTAITAIGNVVIGTTWAHDTKYPFVVRKDGAANTDAAWAVFYDAYWNRALEFLAIMNDGQTDALPAIQGSISSTGAVKDIVIQPNGGYVGIRQKFPETALECNGDITISRMAADTTRWVGQRNMSSHVFQGGIKFVDNANTNTQLEFWTNQGMVGSAARMVIGADGVTTINRDIYVTNNCSALSFTDRTPFFKGDAVAEIKKVTDDGKGQIDHSTLPAFARKTITHTPFNGEITTEEGRDLGAMVSLLTTAVQQLVARIEALENK